MPGAIIIGAGPGIGASVARRFAREGLPIGVVARSQATLNATLSTLPAGAQAHGETADAAEADAVRGALDRLVERIGVPDAVVYNAGHIRADRIGDLTVEQHLHTYAINVLGAITVAAHLLPRMAEAGRSSYLLTGGMPTPMPEVTSLSLGKAGVRALTELLAAQFASKGIHVATVTVAGVVAPGTAFDPDNIAEHYWRLHTQPFGAWDTQYVYGG